jgi:hypothetical protein
MSNALNLEVQGPQQIVGTGSTTFNFSGDVSSFTFGFTQIACASATPGDAQQTFSMLLSSNSGVGGTSVTVDQALTGFNPDTSYSYVTCVATVGSTPNGVQLLTSAQAPIGGPAPTTESANMPTLAVAAAFLSGFYLEFGNDDTDIDGIGAGVGVAIAPSSTTTASMIGSGFLIGDGSGIAASNSYVTGGMILISAPLSGVGVAMQAMVVPGSLNEKVLSGPGNLAVFLQSFSAQYPISSSYGTPTFDHMTVGASKVSLDRWGRARGDLVLSAWGYEGVTTYLGQKRAWYDAATYVLIGMT